MLVAVEGGGFFSSSASGYSKGLILLLGHKNKEKPMRVSPWNQYLLVDKESNPDLQLASRKNQLACGCSSFVCFGCTAPDLESPSPLKVGPTQQHDTLPGPESPDKGKGHICTSDLVVDDDSNKRKLGLKSSLKKPINTVPVAGGVVNEREVLHGNGSNTFGHIEKRKVQWTDTSGGELAEIREFELSDVDGSDDEFDDGNGKSCSCRIM
ncbi:hypothetical protein U1Q18_017647 [Sarracenia purpurea var. burkii]